MGRHFRDITNSTFGKLTARWPVGQQKDHQVVWLFSCECGNLKTTQGSWVTGGSMISCGCHRRKALGIRAWRHGHARGSGTREYRTWHGILDRCTNPKHSCWKDYGGRGIKVCKRWRHSFENFLADMGPKPKGLTIERIDNNEGYSPENCKWATCKEQANNRRPRRLASASDISNT